LPRRQDAWWATQIRDGIRNAHALSVCGNPNFGFKNRQVELEQNIACYFLLGEFLANCLIEALGT
jgi:hypothetical protein